MERLDLLEATGLRAGELEALTWGDLDERRGRLRVVAGKTRQPRWAPLPVNLLGAIATSCRARTATPRR